MGYKWPKEVKFNLVVMISVVVVVVVVTIMVIMVLVIMSIMMIMRNNALVKRGIHCDYIVMETLNLVI